MTERKSASSKKTPSKAELQRRMEETRESISATVSDIKETVQDQYESVKQTVSGITEWREQFLKEPLVWSLGALATGFALGYTLGYAHKNTKAARGKQSEIAAFADSVIDELSAVGNSMVMPALNSSVRQLFGFDVSEVLEEIESARKGTRTRKGTRKSKMPSKSVRRRVAKKSPSGKGKAKRLRAG